MFLLEISIRATASASWSIFPCPHFWTMEMKSWFLLLTIRCGQPAPLWQEEKRSTISAMNSPNGIRILTILKKRSLTGQKRLLSSIPITLQAPFILRRSFRKLLILQDVISLLFFLMKFMTALLWTEKSIFRLLPLRRIFSVLPSAVFPSLIWSQAIVLAGWS